MATVVKKVKLWRRALQNRPGSLAESLRPFAESRVNLQLVMGYVHQNDRRTAELEICCPDGRLAAGAAAKGKFSRAQHTHCVVVEGDDCQGLAHKIAHALADSRLNMTFAIMQSAGSRYAGTFGFESAAAATKAVQIIKKVNTATKSKSTSRRRSRR